jgi:hypothetical protein
MKEYINLDFVKPNKNCNSCDNITDNDFVCFPCEDFQVRQKYSKAIYDTDVIPPEWYIESEEK